MERTGAVEGARVLVIGAGPAGLAVAKRLKGRGIAAHHVDRFGLPGGAYRRMYPSLVLSSRAKLLELPGTPLHLAGQHASARDYATYLELYSETHGLEVQRREVVGVERLEPAARGFHVRFRDQKEPVAYDAVVVATGMCDSPAMPSFPGMVPGIADDGTGDAQRPLILHAQDWEGPESVIGKRVLIVGRAMRAVEIAEECAGAGLRPIVSAHDGVVRSYSRRTLGIDLRIIGYPLLRHLPLRMVSGRCRDGWRFPAIDRGFRRWVARGSILLRPDIARLEGRRAHFVDGSDSEVDVIVCATGYRYETPFLPVAVPRARQGYPLAVDGECVDCKGLFVVGTPCAVRADSQFIHGAVADAGIVADRIARQLGVAA